MKTSFILDTIAQFEAQIAEINAMSNEGWVSQFQSNGLCITTSGGCSGLQFAEITTTEQLEAMAKWGVGMPTFYNGKNEKAAFVTVGKAKKVTVANIEHAIAMFKEVLEGQEAVNG